MIIIIFVKEYYTIVRSKRRITIPLGFKEREPVKIRIERVVQTEEEWEILEARLSEVAAVKIDIPRVQFEDNGWSSVNLQFEDVNLEILVDKKHGILVHSKDVAKACNITSSGLRRQKIRYYVQNDNSGQKL